MIEEHAVTGPHHDLYGAAQRGELHVEYQPVLDAHTKAITGFEALLRWDHPVHGRLLAERFTASIEHGPNAVDLDEWILLAACCTARTWPDPIQVAVNVYPPRLASRAFVDHVRGALEVSGLDPARLSLEVVERAPVLSQPSVQENLRCLAEMGVSLALDDFLVHYSSLSALAKLPAAVVKLDRTFVEPLNHGESSPIAFAVTQLAHDLGLRVVAEGVETHQGEAAAVALGCDLLQGFLYSPAVPASHTCALLRAFGEEAPS